MNERNRALGALPALIIAALSLGGCLSPRYKMASGRVLPPVALDLATSEPPLALRVNTVIACQGAGSWKQAAFWDEYVITLSNTGTGPLMLNSAALTDPAGAGHAPGVDPWALESESKTLERKYADLGLALVRNVAPAATIVGAGAGGVAAAGILSAAAGSIAAATVVALPVYYVGVWAANRHHKAAIETEFHRRRLALPLTLAPGETRTGSWFFPMVPGPRTLSLHWSSGGAVGDLALSLAPLRGLHAAGPGG